MSQEFSITIDINYFYNRCLADLQWHITSFRQMIRFIELHKDEPLISTESASGLGVVVNAEMAPERVARLETARTIVAFSRVFVDFLDFVEALERLHLLPESVDRALSNMDEIEAYVVERIERKAQKIGRQGRISSADKLRAFENVLTEFDLDAGIGLFSIRSALEHHKGVAQEELEFKTYVLGLRLNEQTPTPLGNAIGMHVEAGDRLGIAVIENTRVIQKGERIHFTEAEVEASFLTLSQFLIPKVVTASVERMKAKSLRRKSRT